MKLINPKDINTAINKCYLEYDPGWGQTFDETRVNSFKYYVERTAGLKLDFIPKVDKLTLKYGYELTQVEVVDEKKFMMFQIQYS